MMNLCLWIFVSAGLTVAVVLLSVKIYLLKKSSREIRNDLAEIISSDTNKLIDISSSDKDMKSLASALNVQLKILREEQIRFRQGDLELKAAVTNISHDLRTPLTAIRGYLDMLEKEDLPEQTRRYLSIISGRTEAMKQLTKELLKYSAAVSDETKLKMEEITVNDVLEESISAFYAVLTNRGIVPEINICDEKVRRTLNKTALSRIFSNIISNAVRYSSGDLKITLSTSGCILFENKAEQLDEITVGRLFDRFYTVETAEKSTGIGLSIAKALTEAMGGRISAELDINILKIKLIF